MRKILVLFVGVMTFWSCAKDDETFIEPIEHSVKVTTGKEFANITFEGVKISFLNKETQQIYSAETNSMGEATISLRPGSYNVQASIVIPAEKMKKITSQEQEANFNASLENIIINKEKNETTLLTLVTGHLGNLIIKQIYYAGSDTKNGALYRDQFFEIHNNSNERLYLDGLCFAQLKGTTKNSNKPYYLPNGQYDFSKSVGTEDQGEKANTDYVYAEEIIAFPGTGKQYPIEAGESVIVAQTALNHKQPLTVIEQGKEKTYTVANPDLTIDLGKAKFEGFFAVYLGEKADATDIDVPSAINMEILYKVSGGRDLLLDPLGRDAFAIFYADKKSVDSWRKIPLPSITSDKLNDTTLKLLQIPNNVIIDGIELNTVQENKPKRLPNNIDAGYIKGIKGAYSSESAIRKIAKVIGERVIYQDTNNSSNDFEIIERPDTSSLN